MSAALTMMSRFQDLAGVSVTLVTDAWTSKGSKVSLTAVLAYFITTDFKMEGRLIAVRKTTGPHTADAIQALLEKVSIQAVTNHFANRSVLSDYQ